jgi:hypothetical protein
MLSNTQHVDIADLAWTDIQGAGTGNEIGYISIVVARVGNEMGVQIAATVPDEVMIHVLQRALRKCLNGDIKHLTRSRIKRKTPR